MKRPRRQYFVVFSKDEKYTMKSWLRENPEHIPEGMHPDTHVSRRLRYGLEQDGWEIQETDTEVNLILPAEAGEDDPEAVIELLKEAKSLIARSGAWIQGLEARTASGHWTSPSNPYAVQFCLDGALRRAKFKLNASSKVMSRAYKSIKEGILMASGGTKVPNRKNTSQRPMIWRYNDAPGRTRRNVLDVLDDAIFYLEEIESFEQSLTEFEATAEQAADYVSSYAPKQHQFDYREEYQPRRRHC